MGALTALKRSAAGMLRRLSPRVGYALHYRSAARSLGDQGRRKDELFRELVANSHGLRCLQIGARDRKYAPHWTSVDLYDPADYIDYHYDIHDLRFPEEHFDIVVCDAVLEHVEDPPRAIAELGRVLKRGGRIWVEVPFNQPFHPSPADYWRVSPDGLRIWMKGFDEVASGFFLIHGCATYNGVYFLGRKP